MSRPCLSHAAEQTPAPRFPTARPLALAVHLIVFGGAFALAAHAPEALAQNAPQATASRAYDIPAGPLSSALVRFAREAGVSLVGAGNAAEGKRSPGLKGSYTVQGGFAALLAGSGLEAFRQADGSYGLRPAPVVDKSGEAVLLPMTVTATAERHPGDLPPVYAGGQIARGSRIGMLGNKDVLDTPYNVTSYTAEFIENTGAKTLTDVLTNDPSAAQRVSSSVAIDYNSIRGFVLGEGTGSASFNGLYGILPYWQLADLGFAERVEVFKGPSALLNGMPVDNSVGGTINIVSKRAPLDPVARVGLGYSTRSLATVSTELSRRFGENKEIGIRFNATRRDGEKAVRSAEEDTTSLFLGMDYTGERVRVSADFGRQRRDLSGMTNNGFLLATNVPVPSKLPDNTLNLAPPWIYFNSKDTFGMIRGDIDVNDNLSIYGAYGKNKNETHRAESGYYTINNTQGDFRFTSLSGTLDLIDVESIMTGARYLLRTGPIKHTLDVNWSQLKQNYDTATTNNATIGSGLSNLYNPTQFSMPNLVFQPVYHWREDERTSLGISDTVSMLDDQFQITIGARKQTAERRQWRANGVQTNDYSSSVWSPAVSALIKPFNNVSLYANYIEGLQLGQIVGSTYRNANEVFPPYQSKQYEIGVKVDWNRRLMTSLAAFRIKQPSAISVPSTSGGLPTLELNGEVRNQGVEFNFFGEPVDGFRLNGGITYLDAVLTKTAGGVNEGNQAAAASKWRATLGTEWDATFLPGLTFTARVRYAGKAYVNAANTLSVPSWNLWDAGARYRFTSPWNKPAFINLNVTNVFDKNFWIAIGNGVTMPAPRTISLSTSFDF